MHLMILVSKNLSLALSFSVAQAMMTRLTLNGVLYSIQQKGFGKRATPRHPHLLPTPENYRTQSDPHPEDPPVPERTEQPWTTHPHYVGEKRN